MSSLRGTVIYPYFGEEEETMARITNPLGRRKRGRRTERSSSISSVAVRTGTGGDAPHTGEEIQGTRVLNSSGGTKIRLD